MIFQLDRDDDYCYATLTTSSGSDVICTRGFDHDGQHVADNDSEIIAIWERDGRVLFDIHDHL